MKKFNHTHAALIILLSLITGHNWNSNYADRDTKLNIFKKIINLTYFAGQYNLQLQAYTLFGLDVIVPLKTKQNKKKQSYN